jgi:hypothetical protein
MKMHRKQYERELRKLQGELCHVQESGVSPRVFREVGHAPSDREKTGCISQKRLNRESAEHITTDVGK